MCHNCLKWPSTSCWHISLPHSDVCSQFVFTSLPETILQLLNSLKGYKKGQFWPDLVNTCCAKFPNIPYGYLRLNLEKQQLFFQGSEAKVTAQCGHTVVALACRHEQVLQRTSNSHLAPTLFPQTLHNSHLIAFFVWQGAVALSGFVETQQLTIFELIPQHQTTVTKADRVIWGLWLHWWALWTDAALEGSVNTSACYCDSLLLSNREEL